MLSMYSYFYLPKFRKTLQFFKLLLCTMFGVFWKMLEKQTDNDAALAHKKQVKALFENRQEINLPFQEATFCPKIVPEKKVV